jgi:hypothetical protein
VVAGKSKSGDEKAALARCTTPEVLNSGEGSSGGGPVADTTSASEAAAQVQGSGQFPAGLWSLNTAAQIFSMACFMPDGRDLFHDKEYYGISHLYEPFMTLLRDAAYYSVVFNPSCLEGTFTVKVVSPESSWMRGQPLARQKHTESDPLFAKYNQDDASDYQALAQKVIGKKGKLPDSYSSK